MKFLPSCVVVGNGGLVFGKSTVIRFEWSGLCFATKDQLLACHASLTALLSFANDRCSVELSHFPAFYHIKTSPTTI